MSIVATDLVAVAKATTKYVEDDVTLTGGGAQLQAGLDIRDDGGLNESMEILSSLAGDNTQTFTLRVRTTTGALQTSATLTLNGTTAVAVGISNIERLIQLKALVAGASGTVTVRAAGGGATRGTSVPNAAGSTATGFERLFPNASSDPSVQKVRYDKFFWLNVNTTTTAVSPVFRLTADPSALIRIGVEASGKNDTVTIANRLTTPAGVTFVDDNVDQNGPVDLLTNDKQGIWVEQTAAIGNGPVASNFTTQMAVQTI